MVCRTGPEGVGTVLGGRYRLEELIGRGGTAEVYLGIDELLGRSVAVKLFDLRLTDLNTVVRQRNEMQVLARLTHPNLIAVYDAHIADAADPPTMPGAGRTYLVLELVRGQTLAQKLLRGPMPPGEVAWIGTTLAGVLQAVHAEQLIHRDVKPANILLSESGQIKLGDFGLARILTAESRLTAGADVMGTAAYFSPEQARAGVVGPPADIYSLGLVLLEALTGRKEFPGDPVAAALARLLRDPVIPADLPAPWPTLLPAMTNSDPRERPTAQQVYTALSVVAVPGDQGGPRRRRPDADVPAAGGTTAHIAEPPTVAWSSPMTPFLADPPQTVDRQTRRRALWALAGAAGAVTVAAAALLFTSHFGAHQPTANPITGSTTSMIVRTSPVSHLSRTSSAPARPGTARTSGSLASTAGGPQPAIPTGTATVARSLMAPPTATSARAHPVPVTLAPSTSRATTVPAAPVAAPSPPPSTTPTASGSTTASKSPPGRPTSKGKAPKKPKK